MDYANWMTDTPDVLEKTLAQLVLPEAHDAGTYDVDGGLLPPGGAWGAIVAYLDARGLGEITGPIVSAFTRAQPQSILQQLRGGVRVLDLRVCWENGFRIHHGPIACGTLQAVLADIQTFLAETRHELVVAVASHFAFDTYPAGGDPLTALGQYVIQQLGTQALVACPDDPATHLRRTAVKTMTADGSKVLFAFESDTLDPALRAHIWHPALYRGGYADTTDLAKMVEYEQQQVNAHAIHPSSSLFQLQWLLTPNAEYIIGQIEQAIAAVGIKPSAILAYLDQHGLRLLARRAHGALGAFIATNRHSPINTLRVDYCVGSPAIDLAIARSRMPAPPAQGESEPM